MRLLHAAYLIVGMAACAGKGGADLMNMPALTSEEERVIVHKGTEPPFSGAYLDNKAAGLYVCRRCGAPLYRSEAKFDSRCGWPSFDDELPGAIKRLPDPDGARTEIECAKCGAHLGHVFLGEGFTPKNTRHCVNSVSMHFAPDPARTEKAFFAGGCFWGVEYHFQRAEGVVSTRVGYAGGHKSHPAYEDVCRGGTGHIETVEVVYDPTRTSYETLAKLFFEIHDPTQAGGQGPDIGEQYQSVAFYLSDDQKAIAERLIGILKGKGLAVVTQLRPATVFWPAEDLHQRYYEKKNGVPYCHARTKRF